MIFDFHSIIHHIRHDMMSWQSAAAEPLDPPPNMTAKKRALRDIGTYASSALIQRAVGFIMLPVYTNFLTTADYGVVALLAVVLFLFESVLGARMTSAVPRYYFESDDPDKRKTVVSTALMTTVGFSLIGGALMALASSQLSVLLFKTAEYRHFVALQGILVVTVALVAYGMVFIRLLDKPVWFAVVSVSQLVIQLTMNIVLVVVLKMGVAGVVYSNVISSLLFSSGLCFFTLRRVGFSFDTELAKRLIQFSWPLWVAGVAAIYVSTSSRYYISYFTNLDDVGLFALAYKFATLVTVLTWLPFAQWWETQRFQWLKTSDGGRSKFRASFDMIAAIMILAGLGISVFAGPVIQIMANAAYHPAAAGVPMLVFGLIFTLLANYLNLSFLAADKTNRIARIKWFEAVVITACFLLLVPRFGWHGASFAVLIAGFTMFSVTYFYSRRAKDLGVLPGFLMLLLLLALATLFIDRQLAGSMPLLETIAVKTVLMIGAGATVAFAMWKNSATSWIVQGVVARARRLCQRV